MDNDYPLKRGFRNKVTDFIREYHERHTFFPKQIGISHKAFANHISGIKGKRTLVIKSINGVHIPVIAVDGLSKDSMIANN